MYDEYEGECPHQNCLYCKFARLVHAIQRHFRQRAPIDAKPPSFVVEIWASDMMNYIKFQEVLTKLVNSREDDIQSVGDTIHIPRIGKKTYITADEYPVLAKLWDNEEDDIYDREEVIESGRPTGQAD